MAATSSGLTLPDAPPEQLQAAVESVMRAQSDELRRGAAEAQKADNVRDPRVLARFLALLEVAYLTASADGLADGEREALAHAIENATGGAIDAPMLLTHFADLDDAAEILGRRERLSRTAANFASEDEREQALAFASVVAMADGQLAETELSVLVAMGAQFDFSAARVQAVAQGIAKQIVEALS